MILMYKHGLRLFQRRVPLGQLLPNAHLHSPQCSPSRARGGRRRLVLHRSFIFWGKISIIWNKTYMGIGRGNLSYFSIYLFAVVSRYRCQYRSKRVQCLCMCTHVSLVFCDSAKNLCYISIVCTMRTGYSRFRKKLYFEVSHYSFYIHTCPVQDQNNLLPLLYCF